MTRSTWWYFAYYIFIIVVGIGMLTYAFMCDDYQIAESFIGGALIGHGAMGAYYNNELR